MITKLNDRYKNIFKIGYYYSGTPYRDIIYWLNAPIADGGYELGYLISGKIFLLKYAGNRRVLDLLQNVYEYYIDQGDTELVASEKVAKDMATEIYNMYKEKWARIKLALEAQYNPIENYNSDEEIKRTGDDKTSISSDSDVTHQKSAFDSLTFEDESKVITNSNPANNYSKLDYNSTVTTKKHGNIGVTKTQEMIESEIDMRSLHKLWDIIYDDIGSYILSNIFN